MSVKSTTEESLHLMSRFNEDAEAEDCVAEVIEEVIRGVDLDISSKCAQIIENGLMADVAMYKLQEVVHLATLDHDGIVEEGKILDYLIPDEEPTPSPVDNWARGTVSSRVVKAIEGRFNEHLGRSDGSRTPSCSSYRSSSTRSRSTAGGSRMSSRDRTARPLTSTQGESTDSAPRIIELDDESANIYGDNSNMNSTGHMYDMLQRQKNRLRQLTHTDDTVKDEFQLMQEEVERAKEDLKGKKYTFDQNGQIVLIQPMKSEQLPPFAFNPSLNVNDTHSSHNKKKSSVMGQQQQQKKKKKLRVAGTRGVDDQPTFVPTTSLATTIADTTDEIFLNHGVAIQTNRMSKEGPPIPDDPNKPTRKEYFKRKISHTASLDSSWHDGGDTMNASREDSLRSNSYDLNDQSDSFAEKSSTFTGGSRYKDIDPLEGGRPKPQSLVNATPDASRGTTARSEDLSKKGKQKPPVEPTKPSSSQQASVSLLHGGPHMQGPRDRIPSQALHTRAEKKKYVVPAKNNSVDESDVQSFTSLNSKKSNGTIKKEQLARHLF